jgi:hypothetical protein
MATMIPFTKIAALFSIGMILPQESCVLYSSAFSVSSPSLPPPLHVQRLTDDSGSSSKAFFLLAASSSSDDDLEDDSSQASQQNRKDLNDLDLPDYDQEEILLKMHLALAHPGVAIDDALQTVITYSQSFPFAAVLPVQPLTYLPPADNDGDDGVDIKFLRKKTTEKSAVDGGIRFFIKATTSAPATTPSIEASSGSSNDNIAADDDEEEEEDEEECRMDSHGHCLPSGIEITAKRNSVGQTIRKITAERLVVTAFVAGITGSVETEKYGPPPPIDQVYVTSVYHKWM